MQYSLEKAPCESSILCGIRHRVIGCITLYEYSIFSLGTPTFFLIAKFMLQPILFLNPAPFVFQYISTSPIQIKGII